MADHVYQSIARDLQKKIVSGELPMGSMIPSLQSLSATYFVSPQTAAQAVKLLRGQGLVETLYGKGSLVVSTSVPPPTAEESPRALLRNVAVALSVPSELHPSFIRLVEATAEELRSLQRRELQAGPGLAVNHREPTTENPS